MPRRKIERKVLMPPIIKGLSVTGVRGRKTNEVILLVEEYEAIRLLDYQMMNQEQAARSMQVSRPTLTRIYDQARKKVAMSLVEGRNIVFKSSAVFFEEEWYSCNQCKTKFPVLDSHPVICPDCLSEDVNSLNTQFNKF